MNSHVLLAATGGFTLVMLAGAFVVHREIQREERVRARIRTAHGQPTAPRRHAEPEALRAAAIRALASVGRIILRTGLVSGRTLSEFEGTLAASGLHGAQGVVVFIGAKILAFVGFPAIAWLLVRHFEVSGLWATLLPAGSAILGLLAPDWLVGKQRQRYTQRIEQGLPDALDMLVICAQAGLGMGPAIVRVASELQYAYREIAAEFAQTASELQIMSDSRTAILNLGSRTGLEPLKRLATSLLQTMQYGTPLTDALRVLATEMRQEVMTKREAKAARLPVMLTLPTMVFILPCVFLIAGGPAIIQVMHSLSH